MGGIHHHRPLNAEKPRVADWDREKVRNVAKLLDELEGHPGWVAIQELVRHTVEDATRRMTFTVKPLDHATYANLAGFIRGLKNLQTSVGQVRTEAARLDEEDRRAAMRQTAAEGA
jgi:hypothetical protein